jgi:hypothetical protein
MRAQIGEVDKFIKDIVSGDEPSVASSFPFRSGP